MRPSIKIALAFLVLFLVFFAYVTIKGLNAVGVAARSAKAHHDMAMATMMRDACLNYMVEYNRLPPDADNQKLTTALLGDNSRHIAFLSLRKNQLNADGEVVDRWGTPLRITFKGASGIQVSSAGPDRVFNTPDDIVSSSPETGADHP